MTGYLEDVNQRNAHLLVVNFSVIVYMFPFGLSVGASNIVGKYIGASQPKKAYYSSNMIIVFSQILSVIVICLLFVLQAFIPKILTNEIEVRKILEVLLMYFYFFCIFNFVTVSFAGIYRGIGYQMIIAVVNFICFYIFSIPLAYLLTFPLEFEVYGTRISYLIIVVILYVSYFAIYKFKVDFDIICNETVKRLQSDYGETTSGKRRDSIISVENL